MKCILSSILGLFFIISSFSQEAAFDWAVSFGSSTVEGNRDMDVDDEGNSYITGWFISEIDFDPGPSVYELAPVGGIDCYITKISNDGDFEWAVAIGSVGNEEGLNIAVTEAGYVYITGYFQGTVDFDPSDAVQEMTAVGGEDSFTLKLDTDGNFLWVRTTGDALEDNGKSIITDDADNVYISGFYNGTVDFDPGPSIFDITASGEKDVFIQKLNSDGDFIWARSFG
ncbi:MAG: hypothetical protein GQ574_01170 [Crocinitomix sp.]|nr:hypothetical protein [Crocinitomix sp.]